MRVKHLHLLHIDLQPEEIHFFSHLLDVLISISIEINVRDLEKYIRGGEIYLFLQFVSKLCPVIA